MCLIRNRRCSMKNVFFSLSVFLFTSVTYADHEIILKPGTSVTLEAHEKTRVTCESQNPDLFSCKIKGDAHSNWVFVYIGQEKVGSFEKLPEAADAVLKLKMAGLCK